MLHELFMTDKHRRLVLTQAGTHGSRIIPIYPGVREINFTSGALRRDDRNRSSLAKILLIEPNLNLDIDLQLTVAFADEPVAQDQIVHTVLDRLLRHTAFIIDRLCGYL